MPLKPALNKFTTASPIIASYDAVDFADNTGLVTFFGFVSKEGTTLNHHLNRRAVYSNDIVFITSKSTITGAPVLVSDVDFDTSAFNQPRDVKGTATVTMTLGYGQVAQADGGVGYIIAKLRKWDGTTETEIASAQSESVDFGVAGVPDSKTINISIPINTKVHFRRGDVLRCTPEFYRGSAAVASGTGGDYGYGVDPKDRDDDKKSTNQDPSPGLIQDADTTVMEVQIPFLIT